MIEIEELITEFLEIGGAELENLPPKVKRLLELLLEERKELKVLPNVKTETE